MVPTNNERVGKALELLNAGLGPYVLRKMEAVYGARAAEEARASLKRNDGHRLTSAEYGQWDTQAMLALMWERWNDVFRNTLSAADRSLVSELREVRNRWAHQRAFSTDDTYRALDSISRLLGSISASQVTEVERQKEEVLRLRFEEQLKKELAQTERRPAKLGADPTGKQGDLCASDLLNAGESAIVLFTRDMYLVFDQDGSGSSGYWRTNPSHHLRPDKVIIYNRPADQALGQAEIYLANYVGAVAAAEATWRGRLVIQFQDAKLIGTTNRNWRDFAEAGANPVRYLSNR
jgi:hypothetical protein